MVVGEPSIAKLENGGVDADCTLPDSIAGAAAIELILLKAPAARELWLSVRRQWKPRHIPVHFIKLPSRSPGSPSRTEACTYISAQPAP